MLTQVFSPYWTWEDYNAGLWSKRGDDGMASMSASVLASDAEFAVCIGRLREEWPIAWSVNMTDREHNRRAWLGQASCCIAHGATGEETRAAWATLSDAQRAAANAVAQRHISDFDISRDGLDQCQRRQLTLTF